MTEFLTFMLITFTSQQHGTLDTALLYPSEKACGDALPAVYETIEQHYPDSAAMCRSTRQLSASLRPKARGDDK